MWVRVSLLKFSGEAGLLAAPALPFDSIHQSTWKWNSANFAPTEFSEVRIAPVQHL
jgi:hypothetical protein